MTETGPCPCPDGQCVAQTNDWKASKIREASSGKFFCKVLEQPKQKAPPLMAGSEDPFLCPKCKKNNADVAGDKCYKCKEKESEEARKRAKKTVDNEISKIRSVAATTVAEQWIGTNERWNPNVHKVAFGLPSKEYGTVPIHEKKPGSSQWRTIRLEELNYRLEKDIHEEVIRLCNQNNMDPPVQPVTANALNSCRRLIQVRAVPGTIAKARESNPTLMKSWDMATGELVQGVAFRDAIVTIDNEGKLVKNEIKPTYYISFAIDFDCPDITDPEFPYEWWNYGTTSLGPSRFKLLNEALGMAILRDTRPGRFVFIRGKGGSGKGTFTKLLREVMGGSDMTISAKSPESMAGRFLFANAESKALLVIDDATKQSFGNDHFSRAYTSGLQTIKNITGEDLVSCEVKGGATTYAKLDLTVWFCSNHRMRFPMDLSEIEAWDRRMLVIVFNHPDEIEDIDLNLIDKLLAEKAKIIVYALQQYSLMLSRSSDLRELDWTHPESSATEIKRMHEAVLGINGAFVKECLEEAQGERTHYSAIYAEYMRYALIESDDDFSDRDKKALKNKISDIYQSAIHNSRFMVNYNRELGVENVRIKRPRAVPRIDGDGNVDVDQESAVQ